MDDEKKEGLGEFYSRNYLRSSAASPDDARARHRLAAYLNEYFSDDEREIGLFIERELGLKPRSYGSATYTIYWESFLGKLDIGDFLDVITAVVRFRPQQRKNRKGSIVTYDLLSFTRRVVAEQNLAYRIDDKGGIHPSIDAAFAINSLSLLRRLDDAKLQASAEHIARAERSLLPSSFDGRQAIRSTFDAAENLLKVIFPNCTQLKAQSVTEQLGPYLVSHFREDRTEKQSADKLVKSFIDWIEAAHFYRHASGGTETSQPSEEFTIALVSQGFSFVRWIADIYALQNSTLQE
ncbi:MAG: hypothetical protein V4720_07305 [Pseudomonadota bacterium]